MDAGRARRRGRRGLARAAGRGQPGRRPAARRCPTARWPWPARGCATSPGSRPATRCCGPRSWPATPPRVRDVLDDAARRPRRRAAGHRRPGRRVARTATARGRPRTCWPAPWPAATPAHARIPGKHGARADGVRDRRWSLVPDEPGALGRLLARRRRGRRQPRGPAPRARPRRAGRAGRARGAPGRRRAAHQRPAAARLARARLSRLRCTGWSASGRQSGRSGSYYALRVTEPAAALVIAIDGPSGSGKSSVSRAVARGLGLGYLDTGAMYRALTWWCLARGGRPRRPGGGGRRPRAGCRSTMGTDPAAPSVRVGGRDVDARRSGTTEISAVRLEGRDQPRGPGRAAAAPARHHRRPLAAERRRRGRGPRHHHGRGAGRRRADPARRRARRPGWRRRARELHGEADARRRRRHPRPDRPPRPRRLDGVAVHRRPPTASSPSTPPPWTSSERCRPCWPWSRARRTLPA